MEIWSRRGVTEFCPLKEYLEEVIQEARWLRRREELARDRMFEAAVAARDAKIRLVQGDGRRMTFRFDPSGRRHWRGDKYMIMAVCSKLLKPHSGPLPKDPEYGYELLPDEPMVDLPALSVLTGADLLDAINQIVVQEVLAL